MDHFRVEGMPMEVVSPPLFGGATSCPEAELRRRVRRSTAGSSETTRCLFDFGIVFPTGRP